MSLSASLKTRLGELTEAWNNLTAEDFVDNFFSPDSVILGGEMKRAACLLPERIEVTKAMFAAAKNINLDVVKVIEHEDTVTTWLHWNIIDSTGSVIATMRSLTLWRSFEGTLKIFADYYTDGKLN